MKKHHETDEELLDEEKCLYLLLYAPGHTGKINEPIKGDAWLQKMMHTVSGTTPNVNYGFDESGFKMSSPSLKIIQIRNETAGRIDRPIKNGPFHLSARGMQIAKQRWNGMKKDEKELIIEIKKFLNEMSYLELIAYSTHPETQSEIKPEFMKNRMCAAVNLFKRKKISLKKAASVAGKTVEEFEQILLKKQIKPYELSNEKYKKSLELIKNIT